MSRCVDTGHASSTRRSTPGTGCRAVCSARASELTRSGSERSARALPSSAAGCERRNRSRNNAVSSGVSARLRRGHRVELLAQLLRRLDAVLAHGRLAEVQRLPAQPLRQLGRAGAHQRQAGDRRTRQHRGRATTSPP